MSVLPDILATGMDNDVDYDYDEPEADIGNTSLSMCVIACRHLYCVLTGIFVYFNNCN